MVYLGGAKVSGEPFKPTRERKERIGRVVIAITPVERPGRVGDVVAATTAPDSAVGSRGGFRAGSITRVVRLLITADLTVAIVDV